ncbi:MAG: Dabb family protein [Verrucomicrobiota bacterium]
MITHVVIFWVDKPFAENRDQLLAEAKKLAEIPGVLEYRFGIPTPSTRGAVDDSFAVGISMTFPSQKEADEYQVHPIHKAFLENAFKPYVKRFVVYDWV